MGLGGEIGRREGRGNFDWDVKPTNQPSNKRSHSPMEALRTHFQLFVFM